MRKDVLAGVAAAGAALIGGAAFYYLRERQTEEPEYRPLESDGDYQIRDYPAMTVAETVVEGPRRNALDEGFRILADYIFAKSRDGEKLEMTVPVMQDPGDPMASDPPLFDDDLEGAWRTRFVMPDGRSKGDLPEPPEGVELVELAPRKVAVVSFSGVASDRLRRLAAGEERAFGAAEGLPAGEVTSLLEGRDGTVWVGTRTGLASWDGTRFQVFDRTNGLLLDDVRTLEQDREGAIWIGAMGGVSRLREGRIESWDKADGIPDVAVRSFFQSADGAMWAGTYGAGLVRVAGGKARLYGTAEGFPENVVSRILEDGQGHLWLSGLRGLARFPGGQLEDLAEGRIAAVTPTVYGVADGMRTVECNGGGQPAGWKARDGRLLFPTVHGIAVVDPSRMRRNALAPPVHIEATLVNRRAVPAEALARLPPGRPEIEIRYTAVSFTAPDRVRFRYQLEGYDADWVDPGSRRAAIYTNIPPGKYRFVVKAANADGVWNEAGSSLAVALRPQFHQTAWFPLVVVTVVAGAGAGAASWRLRHLRRRKRELEDLVEARTKELLALNSSLEQRVAENTIEIRATRDMALFALARLAELRDSTTAEHLERIGAYSRRLAEAAGQRLRQPQITAAFVEDLGRSSPLHDIGKVAIPDAILRKPGKLTAEETAIMQTHTTIGGDTLRQVLRSHEGRPGFLEMAMDIAYHHHERWDGTGYPKRLRGEAIPLAARIVALVDAYDALTSERPYKRAFGHDEAVRRILADSGTHFDPLLVDVFSRVEEQFRDIRRRSTERDAAN